jgi:hypothetical protein
MKPKITFTKKDIIVTLACAVFLLANLAAIGPRGKRHAKEMLCLSNLHKWGSVFLAFAADNDGYFMPGWHHEYLSNEDYWMQALRPYYGNNHKLRCCPEAIVPGTELGLSQWGGNGAFTAWGVFEGDICGEPSPVWSPATACDYGSYGMNGYLCNPPPETEPIQGHPANFNFRTANVPGADNIPLLTDNQWIDTWPHHTDPPPDYEGMPWGVDNSIGMYRICINRHEGSINSAFLDASARKVPLKCLWKLKWSRAFDPDQGPTEEEFNNSGDGWMAEFPPCQ